MANFGDQILGVSYQKSTDAIDPGSNQSVYVTALVETGGTARALVVAPGDNLGVAANQTANFNPPIKLPRASTATPAHADLIVAYFIAK